MDDGKKGEALEGNGNEEAVEYIVARLQELVELVEVLVKLGDVQMRELETLIGEIRLDGAWRQLQFVHTVILAITAGMVAVNGVLVGVVLWVIARSSGWQEGLYLFFLLALSVSLYRLLDRYLWSFRRVMGMFKDWQEAALGEDALEEMLEREKVAKKGWLERLLRR